VLDSPRGRFADAGLGVLVLGGISLLGVALVEAIRGLLGVIGAGVIFSCCFVDREARVVSR
jgi:hypothetical protein